MSKNKKRLIVDSNENENLLNTNKQQTIAPTVINTSTSSLLSLKENNFLGENNKSDHVSIYNFFLFINKLV